MVLPFSKREDFPEPLFESESTDAQQESELECAPYFVDLTTLPPDQIDHLRQTGLLSSSPENPLEIKLLRKKHVEYLSQVWKKALSANFVSLDASRPWILYWCLHGIDLLGESPSDEERVRMVETLKHCWSSYSVTQYPVSKEQDPFYFSNCEDSDGFLAGGFGGGPAQLPHAATTYAGVLSLCILATSGGEAETTAKAFLTKIRMPLYRWMVSLLIPESGAFRMHTDGEIDIRASYTILCCAKLLSIDSPYLCQDGVASFIQTCQTFEGGLGGEPWSEAHGGYAFCGVAALSLLGKLDLLDIPALTGWLARRQMSFEGGFSGRSNKLVDGCYSFWQGGTMAIVSQHYAPSDVSSESPALLFDTVMLERYILLCAQDIKGGLRDCPSKSRDFYHSCYNLSGLSIAQTGDKYVAKTDPCYNLCIGRLKEIQSIDWKGKPQDDICT